MTELGQRLVAIMVVVAVAMILLSGVTTYAVLTDGESVTVEFSKNTTQEYSVSGSSGNTDGKNGTDPTASGGNATDSNGTASDDDATDGNDTVTVTNVTEGNETATGGNVTDDNATEGNETALADDVTVAGETSGTDGERRERTAIGDTTAVDARISEVPD